MASNVGVGIYVDTRAFNAQANALRRVDPVAYKNASTALRALTKRTLSVAAANAASFSTRIPLSGKSSVRMLKGKVQFGGGRAYIAVPIENRGEGHVTHPTFGPKGTRETNKNSPPAFLAPAFDESKEEALDILDEAVFSAMEHMTLGNSI